MLAAAKLGGHAAVRLRQPAVLGELLAGVVLGALPLTFLQNVRAEPTVDLIARLGAVILLFEVGLESTVRGVFEVGGAAVRVALLGTIGTFVVGWGASRLLLPRAETTVHAFLGAALTATSIGITARVLKDLGQSQGREARTILSAAVLDDVFGLVVLALVTAVAGHTGEQASLAFSLAVVVGKTLAFLVAAIGLGVKLSPVLFAFASRLRSRGALLATGLCMCFVFAWASDQMGLAPIVGAFAAGLVLEESHAATFVARGEPSLTDAIEPVSSVVVPVFFVLMGMRAEIGALAHPATLLLAGGLTLASIAGKVFCVLGTARGTRRLAVAFGMLPRGEVCLVFASLGLTLRVNGHPLLDVGQYSALVSVVVLTAVVTPPALGWAFARPAPPSPEARPR